MQKAKYILLTFSMTVTVGLGQTNDAAFFRISTPSNAWITDFDPVAGTVTWSNDVAGVTNQLQRAFVLLEATNWINFVQLATTNGSQTGTERIIDLNPPEGMVLIPGGMNCGTNPLAAGETYVPPYYPSNYSHKVTAFYMDQTEVTNDKMVQVMQWAYDNGKLAVNSNTVQNALGDPQELLDLDDEHCRITWDGSSFGMKSAKGTGYPCADESWYGAVAYCNYRSEMEGLTPCYNLTNWSCNFRAGGYRLPKDAEWGMAARGGRNSRRFPWGDTISHARANYHGDSSSYSYDNSDGLHPSYFEGIYPYTSPSGDFPTNGYGLYDMSGNVWEWCNDWFPGFEGSQYVARGGGWGSDAVYSMVGFRTGGTPDGSGDTVGFRVVLPAN